MEEEEITLREKILTHKAAPVLAMVILILFFFKAIPNTTAENYKYFFSIIGGAICVIFSLWIVGIWAPKVFEKIPVFSGIVCISTFFIFGYQFITKTSEYRHTELDTYGVLTESVVISKWQIYGKGGKSINNLKVEFTTKENREHRATVEIGTWEYDDYYQGLRLPIYYSSNNPDIVRIAREKLPQQ